MELDFSNDLCCWSPSKFKTAIPIKAPEEFRSSYAFYPNDLDINLHMNKTGPLFDICDSIESRYVYPPQV